MAASIPTADDVRQIVREELERALGRGREWLSTTEAAHRAGVQPKTVRAWVASGDLPASYRGRRRAIKAADLDAYLGGSTPDPAAAAEAAWRGLRKAS